MNIIIQQIRQKLRHCISEYYVKFINDKLQFYYTVNINQEEFHELIENSKVIETTYDTKNNYFRNSNYIFKEYSLTPIGVLHYKLFQYYIEYKQKLLNYLYSINFIEYNDRIYYLGFKYPYYMPTISTKGYSEKNLSKKELYYYGKKVEKYEIDLNHKPKFIKI